MSKLLPGILITLGILIIGDGISTYLCLTTPSDTYEVWEGVGPVRGLFDTIGLAPGLILIFVTKITLLVWLYRIARKGAVVYWIAVVGTLLGALFLAYANLNNWYIYNLIR